MYMYSVAIREARLSRSYFPCFREFHANFKRIDVRIEVEFPSQSRSITAHFDGVDKSSYMDFHKCSVLHLFLSENIPK